MKTPRNNELENERALVAWQEWKDVCWVSGCSPANKDTLSEEIDTAFKEKINKIEFLSGSARNWDFVQEFDCALVEYEHCEEQGFEVYHKGYYGDKNHVKKAKAWKDYTWSKVADSNDPPLKVIRGILVGPKGIINEIFEDMIERNYSVKNSTRKKDGMRIFVQHESMDKKAYKDENDGKTLTIGDMVEDESSSIFESFLDSSINSEMWTSFEDYLCKYFTSKECAVLLAEIYGIKIYKDEQILLELEIKKSTANKILNNAKEKLKELNSKQSHFAGFVESAIYRKKLIEWMMQRFTVEKSSPTLLSILSHLSHS